MAKQNLRAQSTSSLQAPQAPSAPPPKSRALLWFLGGCLILVIVFVAGMGILGWLGLRKAKTMLKDYEPTIESTQKSIERMNQEAAKWQEKSQQIRDSLPDPEEFKAMQENMNLNDFNSLAPRQN